MSAIYKPRECELQILLLMEIFGWDLSGQPKDSIPDATRVKIRQFLGIWLFSVDLGARALLDNTVLALFGKTHPAFISQLYEDFDQPNPFQASEDPRSKVEVSFLLLFVVCCFFLPLLTLAASPQNLGEFSCSGTQNFPPHTEEGEGGKGTLCFL